MQRANQAAQKLNHEWIDSQHILLGCLRDDASVAINVLHQLVNIDRVKRECETAVPTGCDMVTMGKLPQTPHGKKVIEKAMEQARDWNHNYVGTEHILMGLVADADFLSCQILRRCGASPQLVRERTENLLGTNQSDYNPDLSDRIIRLEQEVKFLRTTLKQIADLARGSEVSCQLVEHVAIVAIKSEPKEPAA